MRTRRAEVAQETLKIIDSGYYTLADQEIVIRDEVRRSIESTKLYAPDDFDQSEMTIPNHSTVIEVYNETTLDGAVNLLSKGKVGALNFASAKNPGGGFMGGAQAQEESIARSSSLYPSIVQMDEMYAFNKSHRTYLYSDYMIYSPGVVVFRDDALNLLQSPYQIDVVTSPAVNVGAIRQNKPQEMKGVEETTLRRMDKMLSLFVLNQVEHVVLGAWGCGVFRNNVDDMVSYFEHYLKGDGKYAKAFKTIRFSVLDSGKKGVFNKFKRLER